MVIDELSAESKNGSIAYAYYYFEYNQADQSVTTVVASLLRQFASWIPEGQMPRELYALYGELRRTGTRPDTKSQLLPNLITVSKRFETRFLVFDALDECKESELQKFLDVLDDLNKSSFKIYITSRPHISKLNRFLQRHDESMELEIVADSTEVTTYVVKRVNEKENLDQGLKKSIIDALTNHLAGTYVPYQLYTPTDVEDFY